MPADFLPAADGCLSSVVARSKGASLRLGRRLQNVSSKDSKTKDGDRGVEVKKRAQSTSVPKTVSWKGCGGRARLRRATARHKLLSELVHLRHNKVQLSRRLDCAYESIQTSLTVGGGPEFCMLCDYVGHATFSRPLLQSDIV